jgi:hypothetical protein
MPFIGFIFAAAASHEQRISVDAGVARPDIQNIY